MANPTAPAEIASATVDGFTVTLTEGFAGYLTEWTMQDGDPFGDATAVRLEDETPEEYVTRKANLLAAAHA